MGGDANPFQRAVSAPLVALYLIVLIVTGTGICHSMRLHLLLCRRPLLRRVLDAQHFGALANAPVNDNVVGMRHQLPRSFDAPDTPLHGVLVKLRGLLYQHVA